MTITIVPFRHVLPIGKRNIRRKTGKHLYPDVRTIFEIGGRCGKWEGRTEPQEALRGTDPIVPVSGTSAGGLTEYDTCRLVDNVPDLIQIGVSKKPFSCHSRALLNGGSGSRTGESR